jgi:alpha-beta hydrolase superfamily lysophospholipase
MYPLSVPTPKGSPAPVYRRLEVRARDGTELVVHEWAPPTIPAGRPVVLFLHGIGMHGEPYGAVAAGFSARGLVFVVPDLRGHGRSGGERGELAPPHVLRADLGAVIGLIQRRHPDAPVVLAGESMGGLLAADYAWRGERPLAGLALLAPAFAVHPSQVKLRELGAVLGSGGVSLDADDKLKASTRDEGFIRALQADELALHRVSSSYLAALAALQLEWPRAAAEVRLPLFVGVAGRERIVDPHAARRVFDRAATPQGEKTWREWDEARHTLCWDPLTPRVVDEVAGWALGCVKRAGEKGREK